MLIQVTYPSENGEKYDYVKDFLLGGLIDSGRIARFRRNSGWVTVGVDPVRGQTSSSSYPGVERRSMASSFAGGRPLQMQQRHHW